MSLPKGLYDLLISYEIEESLQQLPVSYVIERRELKGSDKRQRLIADLAQRLNDMLQDCDADEDADQIELNTINSILSGFENDCAPWASPVEALFGLHDASHEIASPKTGLHQPWLFAASKNDVDLLSELRAELSSADHVDSRPLKTHLSNPNFTP